MNLNSKSLCVVVPYRNRQEHLNIFVPYMKYALKNLNYTICIVEQGDQKLFNRGKLFNIGFSYKNDFDYYCFHDVDMLPMFNFEEIYSYSDRPVNLVSKCTQFRNFDPGSSYYGGVSLFSKQNFIDINGFSNDYFGWGAEDDDLLKRVLSKNYPLVKRSGVYLSLQHQHVGANNNPNYKSNFDKLNNQYLYDLDGLSNLNYTLNNYNKIEDNIHYVNVLI